jgi:hypothetical protein
MSTRTIVITELMTVIQHAQEWFLHAVCDFDTYECDYDAHKCDYDTHECDCDTHECDLHLHDLNFITISVISKRTI